MCTINTNQYLIFENIGTNKNTNPPHPQIIMGGGWGVPVKSFVLWLFFSVDSWDAPEDEDWPELQSNTSVVGGAGQWGPGMPRLKRAQGSRHLGVDMTFSPQGGAIAQHNKQFTSSGNLRSEIGVFITKGGYSDGDSLCCR